MAKNFYQSKTFIFFALYMIYICKCDKEYKTIDLKIYNGDDMSKRIIYIETNDNKCQNRLDPASFYFYNLPSCQFGLGYIDKIPDDFHGERNDSIRYLIASKIIQKHIFSFGKWEFQDNNNIQSKLYLGDTHENFLKENVGTCQIQDHDGYYSCIFNNFTFLDKTYPLKEQKIYKIYFAAEGRYISFPKSFKEKLQNYECKFPTNADDVEFLDLLYCKKLIGSFLPLSFSNDNMKITFEVDSPYRFVDSKKDNYQYRIRTHDRDDIVIPMTALKNFHVQFDIGNSAISFYSDDSSILQLASKEGNYSSSTTLIVIISISGTLIIIIIALLIYRFFRKKNSREIEKEITKFTRQETGVGKFEEEDITSF